MGDKNGDNNWVFGEEQQQQTDGAEPAELNGGRSAAGNIADGGGGIAGSWMGSSWVGSSTTNLAPENTELKLQIAELKIKFLESENKLLKQEKQQEEANKSQKEFNVALVNKVEELTKAVTKLNSEKHTTDMELAILRQQHQAQGDGHSAALVKKLEKKLAHLLAHHWERIGACLIEIVGNCWNSNLGLALSPDCLLVTCQADQGYTSVRSKLAFSDEFLHSSAESEHCRRLFYFEILVKKKFGAGLLYVGLSGSPDFAIAGANDIWVGKSANSFALCSDGTFWNAGSSEAIAHGAGEFGENDVVGFGVLTSPHGQGQQLIITRNGQSIGKLFALPTGIGAELFPTVSLQGYGTTVEANFGADFVTKPFAYNWMVADLCALGLRLEKKQQHSNFVKPNIWDKWNADVTVNGLLATKSRAAYTWGNVFAKFAYATFYFEVLVKVRNNSICIGVSGTDDCTGNGNSCIGMIAGSWSICNGGACFKSRTCLSEHFPGGFGPNETVGCGVCSSSGTGERLFFVTKNGAIFGTPIDLPSNAAEKLYASISLAGQGSVEANFGADLVNKPFKYNIAEHKF